MPIFLRNIKGTTLNLGATTPYIEIRTGDGLLGMLIIHNAEEDRTDILRPDDVEFKVYVKRFGLKRGRIIDASLDSQTS